MQLVSGAIDIPVIASGGLMTGKSVMATMVLGAVAGQLGTAFLGCQEANVTASWRSALKCAQDTDTILTRSFSGKLARGIANRHTKLFEKMEDEIPPFPYINSVTGPLRQHSKQIESCDHQSLWAGQSCRLTRSMGAASLVELLGKELQEAARF